MSGEVWVLVEHWRGRVSDSTYEVLALGREVAGALGGPLQAVLMGAGVREMAATLGAAEEVLLVEHEALADPVPDLHALALAQLLEQRPPRLVLIPQTNVTMELGSLAAARRGLPFVNFCRDVQVTDGQVQVRCVLFGGKVEATVAPHGTPALLGIQPGASSQEAGHAERAPMVTAIALDLAAAPAVRFRSYAEPEAGDVDITREQILVAVGRGIQQEENVALAEELAAALGGAVCGSRPVIDQGWLPVSRQVGASGMTVRPAFYLALGISGTPEHLVGVKDARLIIAINTDARAPIYGAAHYGAVADALEVLPALVETVRRRKKAT